MRFRLKMFLFMTYSRQNTNTENIKYSGMKVSHYYILYENILFIFKYIKYEYNRNCHHSKSEGRGCSMSTQPQCLSCVPHTRCGVFLGIFLSYTSVQIATLSVLQRKTLSSNIDLHSNFLR